MTPAAYGASRAQLWTGVSALFTNAAGHVLLEKVDYRKVCLLPGGGVDAGEPPSAAIAREVNEELGLVRSFLHVLALDWVPPTIPGLHPDMHFPGEHIYVYDGGTLTTDEIAAITLPHQEVTAIVWAEPGELATLMKPGDARRALAALDGRRLTGAVLLENGLPLGAADGGQRDHTTHRLAEPGEPSGVGAVIIDDAAQCSLHLRDEEPTSR